MFYLKIIKKIFSKTLIVMLVFGILFSQNIKIVSAQGLGGNLASSLNLEGVGAIVLQCTSANFGGQSPFGQAVGATVGAAGGGALGGAVGGETGQQIGSALGTVVGGYAGDYVGSMINNAIDNTVDNAVDSAIDSVSSSVPGLNAVIGGGVPVEVKKDSDQAKNIEESTKKQTVKEECLDRIAQWAAITVMDRITFATLDWINSGFEGKPFYLENPEQFFTDLATKEILGFSSNFSANAELYPFGEILARTVLLSFQRTFEQNMVISLNNVLAHGTSQDWESNFSVGGWAGYTAFIEPNNNIFGSYLESSGTLGRRLNGTYNSKAINIQAELQQGMGFLSQRRCVQTQNGGEYIPENDIRHMTITIPITHMEQVPTFLYIYLTACDFPFDTDGDGQDDASGECIGLEQESLILEIAEDYRQRSKCVSWKTITPGNQISESLTRALANPENQLLQVDEFNENLGLILDALFLQLTKEGIEAFTKNNPNNVALQQVNGLNPGQQPNNVTFVELINGSSGSGSSSGGTQGGSAVSFDSGLVEIQRQYLEQSDILINLYVQVFQRTLDLDYCIPGPNPLWQPNSAQAISEVFGYMQGYELFPQESWDDITIAQLLDIVPFIQGLPNAGGNLETIHGFINTIYTLIIESITGVSISGSQLDPEIISKDGQFLPVMFSLFVEYANFINQKFILVDDFQGGVKDLGYEFFFNLSEVNQEIVDYENSINIVEVSLENLIQLREEYADIEHNYILDYLNTAVNQQNIETLQDNLQVFESFLPSQVTYISTNSNNTPYHDAVIALNTEVGQVITPPASYPGYNAILENFVAIMPNLVFQEQLDVVNQKIGQAIEDIGNPSEQSSLIGSIYSCIQQVTQTGAYQNIPFTGETNRLPYPLPISTDIPGLNSLPTTETFLEDVAISADIEDITINLTPASAVGSTNSLNIFEQRFINIGQDLY